MKTITQHTVTEVWQQHAELDFFQIEKQIAAFSKEQPLLVSYLTTSNEEFYNFEEKQLLLYLGVAVWQMFKRSGTAIKKCTSALLLEKQQKNLEMMEYLEGEIQGDFAGTVRSILDNDNQRFIFRHVFHALFEEELNPKYIRAQNKGLLFVDLKTLIDCLDQV
ncbi:MAG: hypothetical protein EHM72_17775 [Calditrichaeota bacterium]|nr:MAG: hypothetical protein EHM72_17775 [Calditrichota bacterium]